MISIIIPTLNEEKYLPKLLDSLKRQSYKNFEVIVVDASKNNKTKKAAKAWKIVKYFKSAKKNISYQKNLGAKKAKGSWLLFLDADMTLPDRNFLKKLSQISAVAVCFPVKVKQTLETKKDKAFQKIYNLSASLSMGSRGAQAIKKDVFKKIHGFNPKLIIAEDVDLIRRARKHGRVVWAGSMVVNEDPRRYKKEGYFKISLDYLIDGIMAVALRRTRKKPREVIR